MQLLVRGTMPMPAICSVFTERGMSTGRELTLRNAFRFIEQSRQTLSIVLSLS
jgi:hypothetical protein